MAEHMEKAAVRNLPTQGYQQVRGTLRSGDLFFCSGDYMVSKLIEKFTKSPWSHVGIIFKIDAIDRVLLLGLLSEKCDGPVTT